MSDRGSRYSEVITDTSKLSDEHLATSRGDGKSYIYSNFNPKYAQMAITILRTYYNFCEPFNSNSVKQTPAQRIGVADRVYNWKDIIYKK